MNLTQKLIRDHLVEGRMEPGAEIGIRVDQTLNQDATGTLVMLGEWYAYSRDVVVR